MNFAIRMQTACVAAVIRCVRARWRERQYGGPQAQHVDYVVGHRIDEGREDDVPFALGDLEAAALD